MVWYLKVLREKVYKKRVTVLKYLKGYFNGKHLITQKKTLKF